MASNKTVIVTGASQSIGAAVVQAFLDRGYNVVATSLSVSKAGFVHSPNLALVDGDRKRLCGFSADCGVQGRPLRDEPAGR
jgi:NAD(P)-dependent dehydrogenase (short-subunit alcohol dehydrogenase family)